MSIFFCDGCQTLKDSDYIEMHTSDIGDLCEHCYELLTEDDIDSQLQDVYYEIGHEDA